MADIIKGCLKQAKLDRKKQRRAIAWLLVLSMATSMGVMWQMHGVGEAKTVEYVCGLEEHTHEDTCYPVHVICGLDEGEGHTHTAECYVQEEVYACGLDEHTHDESCYAIVDELVCPLSETPGHTHTEQCYGDFTAVICGLDEHTHTDACYTEVSTLQCGQPESAPHTHTDACYTSQTNLVCGQAESAGHTHGESCYDQEGNLICDQAESAGHTHSSACYETTTTCTCGQEETAGHTHTEQCYTVERVLSCGQPEHAHAESCTQVQNGLICGQEECQPHTHTPDCFQPVEVLVCRTPEHTHEDSCLELQDRLICTQRQQEAHTHDASCYAYGRLDCSLDHTHTAECYVKRALVCENTSHTHTDSCYVDFAICGQVEHTHDHTCTSNPEADLETRDFWEQSIPKNLTGVWSEDLLKVAASQVGNRESVNNFIVDSNGVRQGYNRYGAFYSGNNSGAYGEWSAKYVIFCLYYAGISGVPTNGGAYAWFVQLRNAGALSSGSPVPGDLVFLDCDGDQEGNTDRVAIVASVQSDSITVYEGDAPDGTVRLYTYALTGTDSVTLTGTYSLPENPALRQTAVEDGEDEEGSMFTQQQLAALEEAGIDPAKIDWDNLEDLDEDTLFLILSILGANDGIETLDDPGTESNRYDLNANNCVSPGKLVVYKNGTMVSGQELTTGTFTVGVDDVTSLEFQMKFTIKQGTLDADKRYAVYTLPDNITVQNGTGYVKNGNNENVGEYKLEGGKLYIDYYPEFAALNQSSDITGTFNLVAKSSNDLFSNSDTTTINFSDDLSVTLTDQREKDLSVEKSGYVRDGEDGYFYLDYTICVKSTKGTAGSITLDDSMTGLPTGSELVGSISVVKNWWEQVNPCPLSFDAATGKITGTLDPLYNNGGSRQYEIKYTVRVPYAQLGDALKVDNTATVKDTKNEGTDTKTLEFKNKVDVTKVQNTNTTATDGKITYTITIKSPYGTNGRNVVLTDTMADFQENIKNLTNGEFDTRRVTIKKNNDTLTTGYTFGTVGEDGLFNLTLPPMVEDDTYTITYTVDLKTDEVLGNSVPIKNTANVYVTDEVGGEKSTEYTITQELLDKVGVVEGNRVKWTITVNKEKVNIAGWTLSDIMDGQSLDFRNVEDLSVSPDQGYRKTDDGKILFDSINDGANTNQYTITYYTSVERSIGDSAPINTPHLGKGERDISGSPASPNWEEWKPFEKSGTSGEVIDGYFPITWTVKLDALKGAIGEGYNSENPENTSWVLSDSMDNLVKMSYDQMVGMMDNLEAAIRKAGVEGLTFTVKNKNGHSWPFPNDWNSSDSELTDEQKAAATYNGFSIVFNKPLPEGKVIEFTYQATAEMVNYEHTYSNEIKYDKLTITGNVPQPNTNDPAVGDLKKEFIEQGKAGSVSGKYIFKIYVDLPDGVTSKQGSDLIITDTIPYGLKIHSIYVAGKNQEDCFTEVFDLDKGNPVQVGVATPASLSLWHEVNGAWSITSVEGTVLVENVSDENGSTQKVTLKVPRDLYDVNQNGKKVTLLIGTDLDTDKLNVTQGEKPYGKWEGTLDNTAHLHIVDTNTDKDSNTVHVKYSEEQKVVDKYVQDESEDNQLTYAIDVNSEAADLIPGEGTNHVVTLVDDLYYQVTSDGSYDKAVVTFKSGSLRIYDVCDGNTVLAPNRYKAKLETKEIDGTVHQILTLELPDNHHLRVTYEYTISGQAGTQLTINNSAKLSGGSWYGDSDDKEEKTKVQQTTMTSEANSISIVKADAENVSFTLKGAVFKLYKYENGTWTEVTTNKQGTPLNLTTGKGGAITFSLKDDDNSKDDLERGVLYKIEEVQAPSGYSLIEGQTTHYFFIKDSTHATVTSKPDDVDASQISALSNGMGLTILNVRDKTKVTLVKVRADDMQTPVLGVQFRVEKWSDNTSNWVLVNSTEEDTTLFTVDENGRVVLSEMDVNVIYKVTEVKAPDEFIKVTQYFYVPGESETVSGPSDLMENGKPVDSVVKLESRALYVKNEVQKSVKVFKKDEDDGHGLGGAVFTLYSWDYNTYNEQTGNYGDYTLLEDDLRTDEDGYLDLSDYLTYNTGYKLVEKTAPSGYTKTDTEYEFWIQSNDTDQFPYVKPLESVRPKLIRVENGHIFEISNKKTGEIPVDTSISVTKKWVDSEYTEIEGYEGSAQVQLMQVPTTSTPVTMLDYNNGNVRFNVLRKEGLTPKLGSFSVNCDQGSKITVTFTYDISTNTWDLSTWKPDCKVKIGENETDITETGVISGNKVDYSFDLTLSGDSTDVTVTLGNNDDVNYRKGEAWSVSVTTQSKGTAVAYRAPVVLNSSNNWSNTFEELPLSNGGTSYTYYIAELSGTPVKVEHDGVVVQTTDAFGSGNFVLYNQPQLVNVTFSKRSVNGDALQGAEFKLELLEEGGTTWTATSDGEGKLTFEGFQAEAGKFYRLTETKAPTGYLCDSGSFTFTVDTTMEEPVPVTDDSTIGIYYKVPNGYVHTAVNAWIPTLPTGKLDVQKVWADGNEGHSAVSYSVYRKTVNTNYESGGAWVGIWDEYSEGMDAMYTTAGTMNPVQLWVPQDGAVIRFRLTYFGSETLKESMLPPSPEPQWWGVPSLLNPESYAQDGYLDYEFVYTAGAISSVFLDLKDSDNVNGNWVCQIYSVQPPAGTPMPAVDSMALYQTGTLSASENADQNWKDSLTGLPLTDGNGNFYTYYVVEDPVSGYVAGYDGNGTQSVTITNTKQETPKTSVSVQKQWKDTDGNPLPDGEKKSITVNLRRVKTNITTGGEGTQGFSLCMDCNKDGMCDAEHTYYVPSGSIVKFAVRYIGSEQNAPTFNTNSCWNIGGENPTTLASCETSSDGKTHTYVLTVHTQTWPHIHFSFDRDVETNVNDWEFEILSVTVPRPDSFTGNAYDTQRLTGEEDIPWSYTWSGLDYSSGNTFYTYFVEEEYVSGFDTTYGVAEDGTVTITNTKKPSYVLPKTGSIGTLPFTVVGLALMGASAGAVVGQATKHTRRRRNPKP